MQCRCENARVGILEDSNEPKHLDGTFRMAPMQHSIPCRKMSSAATLYPKTTWDIHAKACDAASLGIVLPELILLAMPQLPTVGNAALPQLIPCVHLTGRPVSHSHLLLRGEMMVVVVVVVWLMLLMLMMLMMLLLLLVKLAVFRGAHSDLQSNTTCKKQPTTQYNTVFAPHHIFASSPCIHLPKGHCLQLNRPFHACTATQGSLLMIPQERIFQHPYVQDCPWAQILRAVVCTALKQ